MALTDQETAEAAKLIQASNLLDTASGIICDALKAQGPNLPASSRPVYSTAGIRIIGATLDVNRLLQNLLWSFETNSATRHDRATDLAAAWPLFDGAVASMQFGIDNALNVLQELQPAKTYVQQAQALIASVNRNLTYASPFPASYPHIIGPHGDYDLAQSMAILSAKYISEASTGLSYFFFQPGTPDIWKPSSNIFLADLMRAQSAGTAMWTRVMGLTAAVVLPQDQSDIEADVANGSGIRPPSFFRALVQHGLAMATLIGVVNFSGREFKNGVSAQLANILNIGFNIIADLIDGVVPDPRIIGQLRGAANFVGDTVNSWMALDRWSNANLQFFHEIPAAPTTGTASTIPVGFFSAETSELDQIVSIANTIRATLTAKEGTTL